MLCFLSEQFRPVIKIASEFEPLRCPGNSLTRVTQKVFSYCVNTLCTFVYKFDELDKPGLENQEERGRTEESIWAASPNKTMRQLANKGWKSTGIWWHLYRGVEKLSLNCTTGAISPKIWKIIKGEKTVPSCRNIRRSASYQRQTKPLTGSLRGHWRNTRMICKSSGTQAHFWEMTRSGAAARGGGGKYQGRIADEGQDRRHPSARRGSLQTLVDVSWLVRNVIIRRDLEITMVNEL